MRIVHPSRLLTFALVIDAIGSAASALLQLGLPDTLARQLHLPAPWVLGTGAFMLAYAATLAWLARRERLAAAIVVVIATGNLAWALACAAVAASAVPGIDPSGQGVAYLALQGVAVTAFAVLQALGLRRSDAAAPPAVARTVRVA
ncbi:hypothetical protein [Ideonella sp. A 288]|uniref:hypothetical protein n=1 Tax=Ideonella sp. A 288 TaxID=1962181 RepID=UPI000B4C0FF2|nr:hypothetical protein [Ideonella sp. A 288]